MSTGSRQSELRPETGKGKIERIRSLCQSAWTRLAGTLREVRGLRWFLFAGFAAELCYGFLALLPEPPRGASVLLCGLAFGCYGFALLTLRGLASAPWFSPRVILAYATLFRITLLFTPPMFSEDLYRYIWDGRMQQQGINPYRYPPDASELADFRDFRFYRINHPEVPTIYPPLSQDVFFGVVTISASIPMMKVAFTLIEFLGMVILWKLLKTLRGSPVALLLYAWNPLAVVEVAGNGHNDPLGVTCLLLAVLLILQNRSRLSIVALGASIAAKWVSTAFLPVFAASEDHQAPWSRAATRVGIAAGTVGVLCLPYGAAGWGMFTGFREYAARWRHNDFGFSVILEFFEWLDLTEFLKRVIGILPDPTGDSALSQFLYRHSYPLDLAKLAAFFLLVGLTVGLLYGPMSLTRRVFWLMGGILLLAPTLHPWYLLWILPFAALHRSHGWFLFSGLVMLSYLPADQPDVGITLLRLTEYLPFLAMLFLESFRGKRLFGGSPEPVVASTGGSTGPTGPAS